MATIVQRNDQVLRRKARDVPVPDIRSARIRSIIANMKKALASQPDGVALAAPQIGESLRIFIVSERVEELSIKVEERREQQKHISPDAHRYLVFINPVLTRMSRQKQFMEEGCLSVRWLYGKVKRSVKATIRARDERGKLFERGASGLMAQAFQHETDHLDGVLFIDKAVDVQEILPEK